MGHSREALSEAYLAETLEPVLVPLFAIPVALILISTGLRVWVKLTRTASRRLAFDDYFMIYATVCLSLLPI